MEQSNRELMASLRRERWRVSGYAGEHDQSGARVVDQHGTAVLHTVGGLGYHSQPDQWRRYFATAKVASMAPELLDALASLAAGEPGAQAEAELVLARAAHWWE